VLRHEQHLIDEWRPRRCIGERVVLLGEPVAHVVVLAAGLHQTAGFSSDDIKTDARLGVVVHVVEEEAAGPIVLGRCLAGRVRLAGQLFDSLASPPLSLVTLHVQRVQNAVIQIRRIGVIAHPVTEPYSNGRFIIDFGEDFSKTCVDASVDGLHGISHGRRVLRRPLWGGVIVVVPCLVADAVRFAVHAKEEIPVVTAEHVDQQCRALPSALDEAIAEVSDLSGRPIELIAGFLDTVMADQVSHVLVEPSGVDGEADLRVMVAPFEHLETIGSPARGEWGIDDRRPVSSGLEGVPKDAPSLVRSDAMPFEVVRATSELLPALHTVFARTHTRIEIRPDRAHVRPGWTQRVETGGSVRYACERREKPFARPSFKELEVEAVEPDERKLAACIWFRCIEHDWHDVGREEMLALERLKYPFIDSDSGGKVGPQFVLASASDEVSPFVAWKCSRDDAVPRITQIGPPSTLRDPGVVVRHEIVEV